MYNFLLISGEEELEDQDELLMEVKIPMNRRKMFRIVSGCIELVLRLQGTKKVSPGLPCQHVILLTFPI